jgi:hypothetical protein
VRIVCNLGLRAVLTAMEPKNLSAFFVQKLSLCDDNMRSAKLREHFALVHPGNSGDSLESLQIGLSHLKEQNASHSR